MPRGSLPQKGVGSARDIPWASSQLVVVDESGGITANDIVYIKGRSNSFPTVAKANVADAAKSLVPLYVARHGASNGQKVEIVPWKTITADTSSFVAGQSLYLNTTGGYVSTPADLHGPVRVGTVLDSATSGRIQLYPNSEADIRQSFLVKRDVVYTDDPGGSSIVGVFAAPAGTAWLVDAAFVEITTTWDGTGASLKLGTTGDAEAFIATTDVTETSLGFQGGSLAGAIPGVVYAGGDGTSLFATVVKGTSASQGAATFYIRFTRIK